MLEERFQDDGETMTRRWVDRGIQFLQKLVKDIDVESVYERTDDEIHRIARFITEPNVLLNTAAKVLLQINDTRERYVSSN